MPPSYSTIFSAHSIFTLFHIHIPHTPPPISYTSLTIYPILSASSNNLSTLNL
jgi:hypothetical protein